MRDFETQRAERTRRDRPDCPFSASSAFIHGRLVSVFALALLLSLSSLAGCKESGSAGGDPAAKPPNARQASAAPPTFHRDIAPIVFDHCAACHRPQGSGPFSLLSYSDVKNRGPQIAKVTKSRFMPPWLAKPGEYELLGDCHLTDRQIETIVQWVAGGMVEGNPADAPPTPTWREDRYLGQPDLVVTMPKPYRLAADGSDVWRRFVIPVPLKQARYVRAVEIRPGSKRVIHHALAYLDSTDFSRGLAGKDGEPGYEGTISAPEVHSPDGHLINWLPGMVPFIDDPKMAWRLEPGTDFVVEVHMLPSGKPEDVQISLGIYFTDEPPTKFPQLFLLHSEAIDIPPGDKDFAVTDSYVLPVAADLLGLHPHAHLLGRDVTVWAELPAGTKKSLLEIPRWDFSWQSAYRFKKPVPLPAGTKVSMRVSFDNSADNVRNPHNPPQRVHFGYHTYDEMAEVTVQVLPHDEEQSGLLLADFRKRDLYSAIKGHEFRLKFESDNVRLQTDLGVDLYVVGRQDEALEHLRKAVALDPKSAYAHYHLGLIYYKLGQGLKSKQEYEAAIAADPSYYLALGDMGAWHLQRGNLPEAESFYLRSLEQHPDDAVVHNGLGTVYFREGRHAEALKEIREALRINPSYAPARENLDKLKALGGQ